jgi:hypothetical protein
MADSRESTLGMGFLDWPLQDHGDLIHLRRELVGTSKFEVESQESKEGKVGRRSWQPSIAFRLDLRDCKSR